jgi:50S ribosomal subunit-associated GTPase HflX
LVIPTGRRARLPADVPVTLVFNKGDLAAGMPLADTGSGPPRVMLSALTGEGLERLRAHLKQCMGYQTADGGTTAHRSPRMTSWGGSSPDSASASEASRAPRIALRYECASVTRSVIP